MVCAAECVSVCDSMALEMNTYSIFKIEYVFLSFQFSLAPAHTTTCVRSRIYSIE